jgi:hypothetical protein
MKRIALLAAIGAGLLALPNTATAEDGAVNCPAGVGVSADQICVHVSGAGGEFVINNADSCTYVNGWGTNPYAGLCTEAESRGPSCGGAPDADPANTGGCFGITAAPSAVNAALNSAPLSAVTAMLICDDGNPRSAGLDGCFIP